MASRGFSLHIGLNSVSPAYYQGWSGPLVACEADAHDMEHLAKALHYKTQVLLTAQATRAAVLHALTDAAHTLDHDDIFFLSYSGHGGQVPDTNGDEPDHMDETWCLYDGELIDDELHQFYTRFKAGVRLVVLSDSCHSGTVTRVYERIAPVEAEFGMRPPVEFRAKALPRHIQDAVNAAHEKELLDIQKATKDAVKKTPKATVLLISGCQDNQTSADGDKNGLFTENLLKVWNNGTYHHAYRSFQLAIKKQMPPSQQPNYFIVGGANKPFEQQIPFTVAAPPAPAMV